MRGFGAEKGYCLASNLSWRLEVRDVFSMDLKASIVVLSACETGLGKLMNWSDSPEPSSLRVSLR
jgi:CHAT domain-containing protein